MASALFIRAVAQQRQAIPLESNGSALFPVTTGVYLTLAICIDCLFSNLLYFPSSIPFLFNRLQNAPSATPLF